MRICRFISIIGLEDRTLPLPIHPIPQLPRTLKRHNPLWRRHHKQHDTGQRAAERNRRHLATDGSLFSDLRLLWDDDLLIPISVCMRGT